MRDQNRPGVFETVTRRRLLRFGGAAVLGTMAGCVATPREESGPQDVSVPESGITAAPPGDVELPVSDTQLERGAGKDAIPAITEPAFGEDWSGVSVEVPRQFPTAEKTHQTIEPRLSNDDPIIGVERGGESRAYPLRILNWHEVVNDFFGGPLLVTYCPLCGSAIVAKRRVDGTEATFGVSGLLFREDLVMYDERTESLWSQILATAIQGPQTGTELSLEPFTFTTLSEWQRTHPETSVLLPPPESNTVRGRDAVRHYGVNPYEGYESNQDAGLSDDFDDGRLPPKATVLGIAHDGTARAYPAELIRAEQPIEDTVGGLPVVVTTTPDETPIAWVRVVDSEVRSFETAGERHLRAGGSRWDRTTGTAIDGLHKGKTLTQANSVSPMFWFAWLDFQPDTELYSNDQ